MLDKQLETSNHTQDNSSGPSLLALLRSPTKSIDSYNLKSHLNSDTDLSSTNSDTDIEDISLSPTKKQSFATFNINRGCSSRVINLSAAQQSLQPNNKYKTELCKNYEVNSFCKWGDNCYFAHGKSELKTKAPTNMFYKTKLCKHFHQTGFCPYASRCQYLHLQGEQTYQELVKSLDNKIGFCYNQYEVDLEKMAFKYDNTQSRLSVFMSLDCQFCQESIFEDTQDEFN